ncbi:hypothetical protein A6B36_04220 [Lactiplantibacillus plantarum]|nr:hypothetical protein A6B36_04220 [Lactiplantibacillus plantarum]
MIAKLPASYWKASIFLNQILLRIKPMVPRNFASILKIKQASIPFRLRKIPKTSGPVITTFIVSAI